MSLSILPFLSIPIPHSSTAFLNVAFVQLWIQHYEIKQRLVGSIVPHNMVQSIEMFCFLQNLDTDS